jgi:hypothetical protein
MKNMRPRSHDTKLSVLCSGVEWRIVRLEIAYFLCVESERIDDP